MANWVHFGLSARIEGGEEMARLLIVLHRKIFLRKRRPRIVGEGGGRRGAGFTVVKSIL